MSFIDDNSKIRNLCNAIMLGELIGQPEEVSGGLLHKMYCIETTKGKFAVKALNPQIMMRAEVMENYIISEAIANIASKTIPALPAFIFNGSALQEIDNQYYLVFHWVDGRSLYPYEINGSHAEKIGETLGDIHRMDFSCFHVKKHVPARNQLTDWNYYLQKGKEKNEVWVSMMEEVIDSLYKWNSQSEESVSLLSSEMVISHRDMDPKNVLWNNDCPMIIDWESAGYINPMQELIETALYWSENESGIIIKDRFFAFIKGYKKKCVTLKADWKVVLSSIFSGKLAWLQYNLKRSLWIESNDEEDQRLGTAQVIGTIYAIKGYADLVFGLERWLCNEI